MIVPIFAVCSASSAVNALIGGEYLRLFPFGLHESNEPLIYPYVTWQGIGGQPENYLKQRPDADTFTIQVDVFADSPDEAINVAKAVRDAIETHAYITRWGGQGRDPESKRYNLSFDVDWIVRR